MAISNYGELKSKVSRYLFNQRFLADYDDYTTIFEASANTRLRVRQQEVHGFLILPDPEGNFILPGDYLVWRSLTWGGTTPQTVLDYVHPEYLRTTWVERDSGRPKIFSIENNILQVRPWSGAHGSLDLHYYKKILPTLVGDDGNSNWLLREYPNVYLFGLMVEAAGQGRNAEMAQLYKARRDEVFQEIIQLSALTTGATSPLVRTAEYY